MIFLGLRDRSHHLKFLQYENEIVRFYLTKVGKKLKQWKERTATRMKDIKYLHVERERERERERKRERERERETDKLGWEREEGCEYESKKARMRKRKKEIRLRERIIFNLHGTTLVYRSKSA